MFKIQGDTINKEVELIKSALDHEAQNKLSIATESDKKDTNTQSKYLTPPINPVLASYYFDKNFMLARSCDILSEDIMLGNKINITVKEEINENKDTLSSSDSLDITNIINSVTKSQVELSYMCCDYELTGAACCKIVMFEDANEFRLIQLPIESLKIIKVNEPQLQSTPIYLVEQNLGIGTKKYYKILGETYPEEYHLFDGQELGLAWWIGGDNFYKFFKKPKWLQSIESMNSQISIESLDTDKINSGNNVNGILFFNKESGIPIPKPQISNDSDAPDSELQSLLELSGAQTIAKELKAAGTGTAVLYEETKNPMSMQYTAISDNNYNYIQEKSKQADQKIISSFGIPRERYMINDVKESMNSHKTAAFWEIYTKSLNAKQLIYEEGLIDIIYECYPDLGVELDIDIEVPIFSDLVNAKVTVFTDLFLKGIITLKQTLILLSKYITDLNIDDYDFTNPIYDMRFFQGRPLDDYGWSDEDKGLYEEVVESFIPETNGGESILNPVSTD